MVRRFCARILGVPNGFTRRLSLRPIAQYLTSVLGAEELLALDCLGEATDRIVGSLAAGCLLLQENLRFHLRKATTRTSARAPSNGKSVYVNDAFGRVQRAHASTAAVARFMANRVAGILTIRELEALRVVASNPARARGKASGHDGYQVALLPLTIVA